MDGSVDLRLILTIGGVLFSIAAASGVARMQLKIIEEQLRDIEARLRALDTRLDRSEKESEIGHQRVDVLSKMSDPTTLERRAREMAEVIARVKNIDLDVGELKKMHNGTHPPVRVGEP